METMLLQNPKKEKDKEKQVKRLNVTLK